MSRSVIESWHPLALKLSRAINEDLTPEHRLLIVVISMALQDAEGSGVVISDMSRGGKKETATGKLFLKGYGLGMIPVVNMKTGEIIGREAVVKNDRIYRILEVLGIDDGYFHRLMEKNAWWSNFHPETLDKSWHKHYNT